MFIDVLRAYVSLSTLQGRKFHSNVTKLDMSERYLWGIIFFTCTVSVEVLETHNKCLEKCKNDKSDVIVIVFAKNVEKRLFKYFKKCNKCIVERALISTLQYFLERRGKNGDF